VVAPRPRLRWWREVVYTVAIYVVYSTVRNQFGSAGGPSEQSNTIAYEHALDVIAIQKWLQLDFEPPVQSWYLDLPANGWIGFWNVFYGTAHFIVTAAALIWLYRANPARYPLWRNTLACTTVAALIGFASFSLMPPRLLNEPVDRFGPPPAVRAEHRADEGDYGEMVDTLANYPTFWSFDSGTFKNISNQYAAMPSMHIGWSVWAMLVLLPLVRRAWATALIILHPLATLFCILVTANHYWIDGLGGLVTLAFGFVLARALTQFWQRRAATAADPGADGDDNGASPAGSGSPDGSTVVPGVGQERLLPARPPPDA
jgi:hypothetical protein